MVYTNKSGIMHHNYGVYFLEECTDCFEANELINPKQFNHLKDYDYYVEDWVFGKSFLLTENQLNKCLIRESDIDG